MADIPKAIITAADVFIIEDQQYPVRISLSLYLCNPSFGRDFDEVIYFDATTSTACELADLLVEYNDQYMLIFNSKQGDQYDVQWQSPTTVKLCVGECRGLQYLEYELGPMCVLALSQLINQVLQRPDVSQLNVDPLASAKKRMNDNLRGVFG